MRPSARRKSQRAIRRFDIPCFASGVEPKRYRMKLEGAEGMLANLR
jgi:hypothetical protein